MLKSRSSASSLSIPSTTASTVCSPTRTPVDPSTTVSTTPPARMPTTGLPAALVADILDHGGDECLKDNVRGTLGEQGKVNKGIARTLQSQPHRMAPYNNGVTLTASGIEATRNGKVVAITKLINPSFVTIDPSGRYL